MQRAPLAARLGDVVLPSFASEVLRVVLGQRVYTGKGGPYGLERLRIGLSMEIPTTPAGEIWLHYAYSKPERFIHAADLLAGNFGRSRIAGQVVLVGASAPSLGDRWPTPLGETIPGVELVAQIIDGILTKDLLYRPDWVRGAEISLAFIAALIVSAFRHSAWKIILSVTCAFAIAAFLLSWAGFAYQRLVIDPVLPVLIITLTGGATLLLSLRKGAAPG